MSTRAPVGATPVPLRVSVVVCTRDRPRFLARALERLVPSLRPEDELVVVDSASRTAATRRIAEAAGARVVRCGRPGLSRARNAGVMAARAPLVAFTDDDCFVHAGWTAALEGAFDHEAVGLAAGPVLRGGAREPAGAPTRVFRAGDDAASIGHGANMAFRVEALRRIGGFDEALGAGAVWRAAEDWDAFWRVLRAGWEGRFEPAAVVTHDDWREALDFWGAKLGYGVGAGALAVKIARLDGSEGRRMLVDQLLGHGLRRAAVAARDGSGTRAVANLLHALGVAIGAARSASAPIMGGRFAGGIGAERGTDRARP